MGSRPARAVYLSGVPLRIIWCSVATILSSPDVSRVGTVAAAWEKPCPGAQMTARDRITNRSCKQCECFILFTRMQIVRAHWLPLALSTTIGSLGSMVFLFRAGAAWQALVRKTFAPPGGQRISCAYVRGRTLRR